MCVCVCVCTQLATVTMQLKPASRQTGRQNDETLTVQSSRPVLLIQRSCMTSLRQGFITVHVGLQDGRFCWCGPPSTPRPPRSPPLTPTRPPSPTAPGLNAPRISLLPAPKSSVGGNVDLSVQCTTISSTLYSDPLCKYSRRPHE